MPEQLGVAFSGGGIRSAAFCSGVLRWLIDEDKEPDYLSCVSGGGYTGSAYVQWKYFKRNIEDFFDKMRKNTGHICNWQECTRGSCDSLVLVGLFLAIIVPVVGWLSFAFPVALVINLLYGQFLDGTRCRESPHGIDCYERTALFFTSLALFIFSHLFEHCLKNTDKYLTSKTPKATFKLVQLISGSTFAFTFFPWFINDYLRYAGTPVQLSIIGLTAFFWFFVPILRGYSSLVMLIYAYSYIVYWRVYKGALILQYTDDRFRLGMIVSLVLMGIFSVFGEVPQRLGYIYNRWRLEKAFYIKEREGFSCSSCYDCFPGGHCCVCECDCPPKETSGDRDDGKINATDRELTLGDLKKKVKPVYISSVVANKWRRGKDRKYCLLTMSPEGISVIDKQPTSSCEGQSTDVFKMKLSPCDIKLSSAMAISAAAVSPYFGRHEELEQMTTHIFSLLGIEMGANIVFNMNGERDKCSCKNCGPLCSFCVNIIIPAIFIIVGVLAFLGILDVVLFPDSAFSVERVAIIMLVLVFLLLGLAVSVSVYGCCKLSDKLQLEDVARWCGVHVPVYRFIQSMLHIITYGKDPPAMMHLTDGGHIENYGLLPLLKLRLSKIILVHGMETKSKDEYSKDIVMAMELARKILDCSFTSTSNNDVLTDIEKEFVQKESKTYEFIVHYPEDGNGTASGRILILAPRRPDVSMTTGNVNESWGKIRKGKPPLNAKDWGEGPRLTLEDLEAIEGCCRGIGCCDCCHECCEPCYTCCDCCSKRCCTCIKFPRHRTFSQFFTPRLFSAYHREGYSVCMEKKCKDFFNTNTDTQ